MTKTERKYVIVLLALIRFYSNCLSKNAVFLAIHHAGASEEDIKTGERLRKQVAKLEAKIIKEENNG